MPTLDQVKDELDIDRTDTTDDTELSWFLTVATDWVTAKVTDTTPTPVQHAILELVRHLWATQQGPEASPMGDDTDGVGRPDEFFTVPRVRELLGPYLTKPTPSGSFPCPESWPDRVTVLPGFPVVQPSWYRNL